MASVPMTYPVGVKYRRAMTVGSLLLATLLPALTPITLRSEWCAISVFAVCAFALIFGTRSILGSSLLLAPALLFGLLFFTFTLPAALLGLLVATSAGADILAAPHPAAETPEQEKAAFPVQTFFPGVVISSYLICMLLTRDAAAALIGLAALPAMAATALPVLLRRRGTVVPRTFAVAATSAGFAVTLFGLIVYLLVGQYGAFNASIVTRAIADARASANALMLDTVNESLELFKSFGELPEALASLKPEELASQTTTAVFNFLPSALVLLCTVPGYLAQRAFLSARILQEGTEAVDPLECNFLPSLVSAFLFLLAGLVGLIASCAGGELVTVIAENLILILMPPMVVVHVTVDTVRFKHATTAQKVFKIVLTVGIAIFSIPALLFLSAISGAFDTCSLHAFFKRGSAPPPSDPQ